MSSRLGPFERQYGSIWHLSVSHRLNGHKILLDVNSHLVVLPSGSLSSSSPSLAPCPPCTPFWVGLCSRQAENVGTMSRHGVVPSTQQVIAGHGRSAGQRSQFSQDDSDLSSTQPAIPRGTSSNPHRLEIQCHSRSCQDGPVEPAMWSKTKPVFRLVVFNTF